MPVTERVRGVPAGDEEVNAEGIAANRAMVGWLSSRDARYFASLKAHLPRVSGRDLSCVLRQVRRLRLRPGPSLRTQSVRGQAGRCAVRCSARGATTDVLAQMISASSGAFHVL